MIASLRRAGVQCPRDISVAGFDDHPMARLWDLTTIDQHAHAQGVRAAQALARHRRCGWAGGDACTPTPTDRLRVELIIRDSTARADTAGITFR